MFAESDISGPAALLVLNKRRYLFFGGDGHIFVSVTLNGHDWNTKYELFLGPSTDTNAFDLYGVECGPSPVLLSDGNYLFLYNAYSTESREYTVGWLILDGREPRNILKRSSEPLLYAQYAYEEGQTPYKCQSANAVYAKSMVKIEGIFSIIPSICKMQ